MNNYKNRRRAKFCSLLDECELEIRSNKWNPRSLNKITTFLETDSSCINENHPPYGETALVRVIKMSSAKKCPLELVQLLINYGANVNIDSGWYGRMSPMVAVLRHECGLDLIKLLLLAGARIAVTSEEEEDSPILVAALFHFLCSRSQKNLKVLKLLVKHLFLEDPDFEMELFIRRHTKSQCPQLQELIRYANECSRQVQLMRSRNICLNSSLFYFVKRRLSPRMAISGYIPPPLSNKEFNQLVSAMSTSDLSQYFELIANLVGMSTIVTQLQECQFYTMKNGSAMDEKISLNYYCVLQIVRYLSPADLLQLFIAYAPDNYVGAEYTVKSLNKRQKL